MDNAKFTKIDEDFICECCGEKVKSLRYTSRDHCPKCLISLHVDINPGDRQNECKGQLVPIGIRIDNQKGYIIEYKCEACGKLHNNIAAKDDNFNTILSVMNHTYKKPTHKTTIEG